MRRLSRVFGGNPSEAPAEKADNEWIVEERSIDHFRPIRVVVIGSGLSGIISSIRLRQRVPNLDLCVYDRNDDVGGTWTENRYPGCACGMCFSTSRVLRCSYFGFLHFLQGLSWLTSCGSQISQHIHIKPRSNPTRNGHRFTPRPQKSINIGSALLTNTDV